MWESYGSGTEQYFKYSYEFKYLYFLYSSERGIMIDIYDKERYERVDQVCLSIYFLDIANPTLEELVMLDLGVKGAMKAFQCMTDELKDFLGGKDV